MKIRVSGRPQRKIDDRSIHERKPVSRELIFPFSPAPSVPPQVSLHEEARQQPGNPRRPHQSGDEQQAMRSCSRMDNQPVENRAELKCQDEIDDDGYLRATCLSFRHGSVLLVFGASGPANAAELYPKLSPPASTSCHARFENRAPSDSGITFPL